MIKVQQLTKYYGPYRAINDISFNVNDGEIVGFLGPNGAGKTTTMKVITGYIPPTLGSVSVGGFDVVRQSLAVRQRIGYLPETVPLYTDMTPREYLHYMGKLRGMNDSGKRKQRVEDVMAVTGISEMSNRLIAKLSRGYRQRVGIAQAMVHNPEVLILDEPTVGLDPRQIIEVRELIRELGKTHTIILSTHILPEVSMLCQRVIIINRGEIAVDDTLAHLESSLTSTDRLEVLAQGSLAPLKSTIAQVAGVQSLELLTPLTGDRPNQYRFLVEAAAGSDLRANLAAALVAGGTALLELKTRRLTLEDIFINATARDEDDAQDDAYYDPATAPDHNPTIAEVTAETADEEVAS